MTKRAAYVAKFLLTMRDRISTTRCIIGRHSRCQELHEERKALEIADRLRSRKTRGAVDHRAVIRNRRILAGRVVIALVLEELVADPYLNIIRLAGEH